MSPRPASPDDRRAAPAATRAARKLRELRWRAAGHYSRALPASFTAPLRGARALEIGGPSAVFGSEGLLPLYPILDSVDCVQWAARTAWHSLDEDDGYRPEGERRGDLLLSDDVDLGEIDDGAYDAVVSSHVIEHFANPLRAVAAWRRVTRPGGHLLVVAPHKEGTFDHRRATTSLDHLIEDRDRNTREDDLTHLDETLELHDRTRDGDPADHESWAQRRRENPSTRLLHHHTFTTPSLLAALDHSGVQLLAVEVRHPHDIYVIGSWPADGSRADNSRILSARLRSPFRADRRPALRGRDSSAT